MVNLQAKVAPSHIGANHLPCSEEEDGDSGGLNSPSEIKKIIIIKIKKTDHNQQCPFQKTKQTITEDFIFSHFHINCCTGRKLIQRDNYVVISISNSIFTVTLEQQNKNNCLLSFLVQIRDMFRLTSPSMNPVVNEVLFLLLLCEKSLLCENFSMSNVHFPKIHTQLDIGILADVSIFETGFGRFRTVFIYAVFGRFRTVLIYFTDIYTF